MALSLACGRVESVVLSPCIITRRNRRGMGSQFGRALACCKVGLDRPLIPTAVVAILFRSARVFRWGAAGRGLGDRRSQRTGGSGDHCPNQHVQNSLFTGTGRACGKEKSRKPESREPSTPVAEGATHSLARGKRGWPFVPDLCAVVNSDRMICLCQTPLTPRAAFPLRQHAGLLLTPNCQRPPALSRHTEFTTGLPESCER